MNCDRIGQVHAYHDGQLGPAARAEFDAHLAACAGCARRLDEVRAVSRLVAEATLPEAPAPTPERYYDAWHAARERHGVLRISSWLTGAAAAVLVGSLLLFPKSDEGQSTQVVDATVTPWETVAVMPPPDRGIERPDQFIELAQWISEDLAADAVR